VKPSLIACFLYAFIASTSYVLASRADAVAREIIDSAGLKGGLILHLGCGNGTLTAALCASDAFVVQGLDRDPGNVAKARAHVLATGMYGKVTIDHWHGGGLPFIDNLVNLIVVSERAAEVTRNELLHVLQPGGAAVFIDSEWRIKTRRLQKPWPPDIDEWTHYLHGPDNNAVAKDKVVGPPKHYQWIGSPCYLRHHDYLSGLSAMVSAKGRIFYIIDLGPRWSIEMPPVWTLIARDAFNGTILWQRAIHKWHPHMWPLKKGPAQIMRRLVAVGYVVYVTLYDRA